MTRAPLWTDYEKHVIHRMRARGHSPQEMAACLGRSLMATIRMIAELGLSQRRRKQRAKASTLRLPAVEPTLDNLITGTPIPGRSALDGWTQRGEPEVGTGHGYAARPEPWNPVRARDAGGDAR